VPRAQKCTLSPKDFETERARTLKDRKELLNWFLELLSTLIRSRFQVKPATLLIPIDIFFLLVVEELCGARYQ
jgi:hypothetical protein